MVRDWHGAWHAGAGTWRDMKSLNLRSIGIENVNDGHSPFSQAQVVKKRKKMFLSAYLDYCID